MKTRLGMVSAMFLLLGMVFALPADAKQSFRGEMELYFNSGFNPMLEVPVGCSNITWAGVLEVDGDEYGITYEPFGRQDTGKAYHFQEIWRIHNDPFDFEGGVFTDCDAAVAMWGSNSGVASPNFKGVANGTVEDVTDDGPFDESLTGRHVHWSGAVGMNELGLTFAGPFRIN